MKAKTKTRKRFAARQDTRTGVALTYSAAITLYLAYLGFAGRLSGILLWPAVVLHVILTGLLTLSSTSDKKTKT